MKQYLLFHLVSLLLLLSCHANNNGDDDDDDDGRTTESNVFNSKNEKIIKVTDTRSGKVVIVKCGDCFRVSGNPPTVTILPLKPEVVGAVLSQKDSFVTKALKERDHNPNANFFLMSLYDAQRRGDLVRVAQTILYYEFFGEALP